MYVLTFRTWGYELSMIAEYVHVRSHGVYYDQILRSMGITKQHYWCMQATYSLRNVVYQNQHYTSTYTDIYHICTDHLYRYSVCIHINPPGTCYYAIYDMFYATSRCCQHVHNFSLTHWGLALFTKKKTILVNLNSNFMNN